MSNVQYRKKVQWKRKKVKRNGVRLSRDIKLEKEEDERGWRQDSMFKITSEKVWGKRTFLFNKMHIF